jgi:hypothetical protein
LLSACEEANSPHREKHSRVQASFSVISPKIGTITMRTIHVQEKTGADGMLHFHIPLGKPEAEFEVVVIVQPKETSTGDMTVHERGWPQGYFESTFGSLTDETFVRPPQGELPKPVEFE